MKSYFSIIAAGLMLLAAAPAGADEGSKGDAQSECSKKSCSKEACESGEGAGCSIAKAMEALPQLAFAVGDQQLCCEASAGAVAADTGKPVHYLVGKQEFEDKGQAMKALAEATEKFVADFATPHTCNVSGKTTLAGQSLTCSATAGKLAAVAKEAMAEVKLAYKVGDEQCACPNKAASLAAASGEDKEFVIGEETTTCSIDARIKLARAKYEAAVKALAKAQTEQS